MTSEEFENIKNILVSWANYNYCLRLLKYEIDETVKLCISFENTKKEMEMYMEKDVVQTAENALGYCKGRVEKLNQSVKETMAIKEKIDTIVDGLYPMDKRLIVSRYVKKQEWTNIADLWPCKVSSRQVQRWHKIILEEIWNKYNEIKQQ